MDLTEYGQFPLRQFLGMDVEELEPGHALASITIDDQHLNPNGVVHGGVIFTMVDTAMGKATMSVLEAGRLCASVEVQLRFLRPAGAGRLEAIASVVRRGRRIFHLEAKVRDEAGTLITAGAGTFAVIEAPDG